MRGERERRLRKGLGVRRETERGKECFLVSREGQREGRKRGKVSTERERGRERVHQQGRRDGKKGREWELLSCFNRLIDQGRWSERETCQFCFQSTFQT